MTWVLLNGYQTFMRAFFHSINISSEHFVATTLLSHLHWEIHWVYFQAISVTFGSDGRLKSMKNLKSGLSIPITQDFLFYYSHAGNNSKPEFRASGAYVFRPNVSNSKAHSANGSEASTSFRSYKAQVGPRRRRCCKREVE